MIKKCPTCGSKKIKGKLICPDCGYQIKEQDQHTNEEKNNSQLPIDSSEEHFPDTELNDPIEWSELTELPLESVMALFKEESSEETNLAETNDAEDVVTKKANKKPSTSEEGTDSKKQVNGDEMTDELEAEQQKRVAELKEFVDHEKENSILSAYIKAHREDTTEEHAEELMRMIQEELAAKNAKETDSKQESTVPGTNERETKEKETVDTKDSVVQPTDHQAIDQEETFETATEKNHERLTAPQTSEENQLLSSKEQTEEPVPASKTTHVQSSSEKLLIGKKEVEEKTSVEDVDKNSTHEDEALNENLKPEVSEKDIPKAAPSQENQSNGEVLKEEIRKKDSSKPEAIEKPELSNEIDQRTETEQKEPVTSAKTDEGKRKRSKKGPYLALAAIVLLGVGGWAYYDHQQDVQAQIAAQEERQKQKVADLQTALNAFYTDPSHQFIRTSMINQDLAKLKTDLNDVKNEKEYPELEKTFQDIQTKIKDIQRVNQLFTSVVIDDDHLAADPKLKEDQAIQPMTTNETAFGRLIKQAQTEAEDQYKQLQTAKDKVNVVYHDNQVVDSANREQYDEAKKAVEQIKNEELAVALKDQLKKVDETLNAKEQKEAQAKEEAKKAAEAAKQAAALAAQQAKSSSTTNKTNSANQPIMSTRQSDVADASNPAWNWAPGVQQSVIATCIQRGYIVAGGYKLEKARIENGEGYYNLYATSTQSNLMRGIGESALPFYIVTINCKTGWFGGNGSY
ncbi:TFIIB-type zinc ribbon-containing protein [Enterococcus hirae]|nr:TFIIB-type zinc ribbon-containing protein [Enterococcus hirae]EMF0192341.1 TFIIB-type zinc ribbon-containing protein [Enterococcus hirae]EMF0241093.1 TFIIB-type zinc ribbon-containing protein [Enterococcus hirae]EMF0244761.1 TFIIB-type zinc ribbon-containing protein [Enterococcus hirae]